MAEFPSDSSDATLRASEHSGIIEAEDYFRDYQSDEGVDAGTATSSLTSITSSVLQGKLEGGRTYASYGSKEYGFPMDEDELDRVDMCHAKYFALLEKKQYLAPIGDHPQKILDLGCGTGIWSIDIADKFPSAQVVGIDIAPTQPEWVPPNCQFELDDMEATWTWPKNSFDYIFSRDLICSVRDWPKLVDQCYEHLKPGGWVEFESVTGVVACDDGTLPSNSVMQDFSDKLGTACEKFGTPVDDPTRWKRWFEERGFVNVTQKILRLPCSAWPKDPRLKLLGAWEMENLLFGLNGMTARLFSTAFQWTQEELEVFLVNVRRDIKNLNQHAYWPFYVTYAQKPETSPP